MWSEDRKICSSGDVIWQVPASCSRCVCGLSWPGIFGSDLWNIQQSNASPCADPTNICRATDKCNGRALSSLTGTVSDPCVHPNILYGAFKEALYKYSRKVAVSQIWRTSFTSETRVPITGLSYQTVSDLGSYHFLYDRLFKSKTVWNMCSKEPHQETFL